MNDQIKVIGGLVNYNCLKALYNLAINMDKEFYLGYYDNNEKAKIIGEVARRFKNPVFISNDGSSHDSNQHFELLQIIDEPISRRFAEMIAKTHSWNEKQTSVATAIVASHDMPFTTWTKVEGKRRLLASGTLHGTVFSGHPTRTTFGNSVRVYLYTDYIMHLAKI